MKTPHTLILLLLTITPTLLSININDHDHDQQIPGGFRNLDKDDNQSQTLDLALSTLRRDFKHSCNLDDTYEVVSITDVRVITPP